MRYLLCHFDYFDDAADYIYAITPPFPFRRHSSMPSLRFIFCRHFISLFIDEYSPDAAADYLLFTSLSPLAIFIIDYSFFAP